MFKDKDGNNTPNDPKQDLYHYSDDDTKRKFRTNHFKFPKYKDRKSIFGQTKLTMPQSTKNRGSFSDCANRITSASLKAIEVQKEPWIPANKKMLQIDKVRKGILDEEFRGKRARTVDKPEKMYDVVETIDDTEQEESESEKGSSSKALDHKKSEESPKIYANSENNEFNDSLDILKNESGLTNYPLELMIMQKLEEAKPRNSQTDCIENFLEKKNPIGEDSFLKDNLHLLGLFALDQVKEKEHQNNIPEFKTNDEIAFGKTQMVMGSNSSIENKIMENNSIKLEISASNSSIENKIKNSISSSNKIKKDVTIETNSSIENKIMEDPMKKKKKDFISKKINKKSIDSVENNKNKDFADESTPKKDANDLSIKTDSSSDEYSSTDQPNASTFDKKQDDSKVNTQNSILSFKYVRNIQRKSVSIVSGFFPKLGKRDSVSISKKDMNDMGLNLEIVRLGNNIKVNKNRVNYDDILKGLLELFIRNSCNCDVANLRSIKIIINNF